MVGISTLIIFKLSTTLVARESSRSSNIISQCRFFFGVQRRGSDAYGPSFRSFLVCWCNGLFVRFFRLKFQLHHPWIFLLLLTGYYDRAGILLITATRRRSSGGGLVNSSRIITKMLEKLWRSKKGSIERISEILTPFGIRHVAFSIMFDNSH